MALPRVASLLPSATEMLCAIGGEHLLVGRSHEDNFPSSIADRPVLTATRLPENPSSAEIDAAVSKAVRDGHELYAILGNELQRLKPTVILTQERNLLAVAYLSAVGSRRAAWRVITSAEQRERSKGNEDQAKYAKGYCPKVEGELHKTCVAVSGLLDGNPIGKSTTGESKGFDHKMQAGFFCHIAEFCDGVVKSKAAESARLAYEEVQKVAEKDLPATHPIRLGLAQVYSAYQYEVLPIPDEACMMARTAFDGAVAELDNLAEDSYMDSTLILHLLRANLMFRTSDQEGGGNL